MERIMTVEEKIRRAEEIYQRRKQGETRPVAKVSVNNKKDINLLKKMIIQLLICTVIYLVIYVIQNNQYIFSQDFINKINEILSYDTNFMTIYDGIKGQIESFISKPEEDNEETDEKNEEENNQEPNEETQEKNENEANENTNPQEIQQNSDNVAIGGASEEEIKVQNIKNTATFIKPIEGKITSGYGERDNQGNSAISTNHTGIDIAANLGTKIIAATDGEVVLASEEGGYGKHIKVQIGEVSIIYAHCNKLYVKQGDQVKQGQEIAEVGSTGNSTGPHLHFEIRISEQTIDPQLIVQY